MPATTPNPGLHYHYPLSEREPRLLECDICVYGGGAGGVVAAVQAARLGRSVVLLEFGRHLGGMSSGGPAATDIGIANTGSRAATGGIAREFYRRLGKRSGSDEQWTFAPSAAEAVCEELVAEHKVQVLFEARLKSAGTDDGRITTLALEDGSSIHAQYYIDASHEGDLMARAGVSYAIGREANAVYGETQNGIHYGGDLEILATVDPWLKPGDPASGLLPLLSADAPPEPGAGDHRVQAYGFRLCLSNHDDQKLPFAKPDGYDPARYELLRRYLVADGVSIVDGAPLPDNKLISDGLGEVSTDHVGANQRWPEGGYEEREAIFQDHVAYTRGLLYFLANDPGLPQAVCNAVGRYGLAKDEFPETGGFPHQLCVREARRLVGAVVMTEQHYRGTAVAEDPIGLTAGIIASRPCQRLVRNGRPVNEGSIAVVGLVPWYPISYRAIVPKKEQCANLLVPVCLSASHLAFGSIRMEPVFMVLGQSAATAASLAISGDLAVQDVDYAKLRERLLADGQILRWEKPAAK